MSLNVKNLFKRYGSSWVWKDVSFEAASGQVFGIFGPSGSGKTSLLRVLAGLDRSNGGSIFLDDRDVTNGSSTRRGFRLVSHAQQSGWRSFFTSADHEDAGVRLENAVASGAEVLLLDDPFAAMGRCEREVFAARIRGVAGERGLVVVAATDDYDYVFDLCDRVAIFAGKSIDQIGEPQEVYERPRSAAVATLVGRNNIFESRRLTSSKADHPEFITLAGEHRLFAEKADVKKLGAINKNVLLSIRPENISISFGASFPEDNLLKAVVTDVKPRGASTLVELDSNGLELQAIVLRLVGLNIGDECMIGLPPDRIQILAD